MKESRLHSELDAEGKKGQFRFFLSLSKIISRPGRVNRWCRKGKNVENSFDPGISEASKAHILILFQNSDYSSSQEGISIRLLDS